MIMMKHTDSDQGRSVPGPVTKFRRRWQAISALIIFLWAGWALLDAFVIPRDIIAVEEAGAAPAETADARPAETADIQPAETADAEPADSTGPETDILQSDDREALSEPEHEKTEYGEAEPEMDEAPAAALDEPVITDHSYDDGYTSIEISTMRMLDTDIYIADVEITDPSLICTALAEGAFGRNLTEPTSVIAKRNGGVRETFTVRRVSYGIGVERTFPIHSPRVDHVEVIRHGKVRRAKLYYLRDRQGKAAKIKEVRRV